MEKSKSQSQSKPQSKSIAQSLREAAAKLKSSKNAIAGAAIDAVGETIPVAEGYVSLMRSYIASAEMVAAAAKKIVDSPDLRAQLTTLVGNVVNDAGSRINELANIAEALAASPEVQQKCTQAKKNFQESTKAWDKVKRRRKGQDQEGQEDLGEDQEV